MKKLSFLLLVFFVFSNFTFAEKHKAFSRVENGKIIDGDFEGGEVFIEDSVVVIKTKQHTEFFDFFNLFLIFNEEVLVCELIASGNNRLVVKIVKKFKKQLYWETKLVEDPDAPGIFYAEDTNGFYDTYYYHPNGTSGGDGEIWWETIIYNYREYNLRKLMLYKN